MPTDIRVTNLGDADQRLRKFAKNLEDFTPFWRELSEHLATETQQRWPLRRRSGRLRRSLTWRGERLGKHGVFEASADRLRFGSALFYGRFHQSGTKHAPRRTLIHVDQDDTSTRFAAWARDRAEQSGLEVTR